ncbi:MAG: DUF2336 domain-containing protein [Inquilinus sp.]|nr:DUF2336 domain-containing protein [Inquilinus sp.]
MTTQPSRASGAPDGDEAAKRAVRDPDPAVRRAAAESADLSPELLFFLAADTAAEVRRQVAGNRATPGQADMLLAEDSEEEVRGTLLDKAVGRIPANGTDPQGPLEKLTLQVLTVLARDPSPQIRRLLAESIRALEHAPQAVVSVLAGDTETAVAVPVLRHSPQLTDTDLLAAVAGEAEPARIAAVAQRPTLSSKVADAIVRTDDIEAVALLLDNESAQIREETLDHILAKAPSRPSWHRPLVYRPDLSGQAVRRLARFVAMSLVEVLQARKSLDPMVVREVAEVFCARFERDGVALADTDEPPVGRRPVDGGARAEALAREGALTEEEIDDAIFAGDRSFVIAALAALTGIPRSTVERILEAQSARGVVSLAWKAGLGIRLAMKVQMQIAQIPPKAMVNARDGTQFPLTEKEMEWQLEFFGTGDGD